MTANSHDGIASLIAFGGAGSSSPLPSASPTYSARTDVAPQLSHFGGGVPIFGGLRESFVNTRFSPGKPKPSDAQLAVTCKGDPPTSRKGVTAG